MTLRKFWRITLRQTDPETGQLNELSGEISALMKPSGPTLNVYARDIAGLPSRGPALDPYQGASDPAGRQLIDHGFRVISVEEVA